MKKNKSKEPKTFIYIYDSEVLRVDESLHKELDKARFNSMAGIISHARQTNDPRVTCLGVVEINYDKDEALHRYTMNEEGLIEFEDNHL